MRKFHPLHLQYELFDSRNPLLSWLESTARQVRENRRPVTQDNRFLQVQQQISDQIVAALKRWRKTAGQLRVGLGLQR